MGRRDRPDTRANPAVVWAVAIVAIVFLLVWGNDRSTTDNEVRLECVKHQPLAECKDVR